MKSYYNPIYILILFPVLGCATIGEMRLANAKIHALNTNQKEILDRVGHLEDRTKKLYDFILSVKQLTGKSRADLSADLMATHNRINKVEGRLEELEYKINLIAQELQKVEKLLDEKFALGLTTLPKDLKRDPEHLKSFIKKSLKDNKLDSALVGARLYMELYPDAPDAPEIQYYLGDILLRQGKYGDSLRELKRCYEKYRDSKSSWPFKALERMVDAFLAQKNCKKAKTLLRFIIDNSRGKFRKQARIRLKKVLKLCKGKR